jgi:hypothetical protein
MKIMIRDFEIESRFEKAVKFTEIEKVRKYFRADSRFFWDSLWRYDTQFKRGDPSWKEKILYNKFAILVSRGIGTKKITRRFDYYASQDNCKKGIVPDLDKNTLKWFFLVILNHACRAATEDFNDYDNDELFSDGKEALEEYKTDQEILKKLLDLGKTDVLTNIRNELVKRLIWGYK